MAQNLSNRLARLESPPATRLALLERDVALGRRRIEELSTADLELMVNSTPAHVRAALESMTDTELEQVAHGDSAPLRARGIVGDAENQAPWNWR